MQHTDQSMTLNDLMLRLAVRFGVAGSTDDPDDNAPTLPTEIAVVKRLRMAINDGARAFYAANPKWKWRTRTIARSTKADGSTDAHVGLDPSKVFFGYGITAGPVFDLRYVEGNASYKLTPASPQQIADLKASAATTTGVPCYAAIDLETDGTGIGSRARTVVKLFPTPTANGTLIGTFRLMPYPLTNGAERLPCPSVHDDTLLAFAAYALASTGKMGTSPDLSALERERDRALAFSMQEDAMMGMPSIPSAIPKFAPNPVNDGVDIVTVWPAQMIA